MATYDYHCRECHEWAEVTRSIHDVEEAVSCPKCNEAMHRVYGPIGIVLRSSGFHKTDARPTNTNFYPENGATF